MAKTTTINVSVEPEMKKKAEELFSVLGISISDAFNMFICQAVRDNGIPFRVTADPPYADKLDVALAELERGESEVFDSIDELFADLNAEDDDEI